MSLPRTSTGRPLARCRTIASADVMAITECSIADFCQTRAPPKQPAWVSKGGAGNPRVSLSGRRAPFEKNTCARQAFLRHLLPAASSLGGTAIGTTHLKLGPSFQHWDPNLGNGTRFEPSIEADPAPNAVAPLRAPRPVYCD